MTKSRIEIKKNKEKDLEKYKKSEQIQEKDVLSKTKIAELAPELEGNMTQEGWETVKKQVEAAGENCQQHLDQEINELNDYIQSEVQPNLENLNEMAEKSKEDLEKTKRTFAAVEVSEAKNNLDQAAQETSKDIDLTEGEHREQTETKQKTESESTSNMEASRATIVNFRK